MKIIVIGILFFSQKLKECTKNEAMNLFNIAKFFYKSFYSIVIKNTGCLNIYQSNFFAKIDQIMESIHSIKQFYELIEEKDENKILLIFEKEFKEFWNYKNRNFQNISEYNCKDLNEMIEVKINEIYCKKTAKIKDLPEIFVYEDKNLSIQVAFKSFLEILNLNIT